MVDIYGKRGKQWLSSLPRILKNLANQYQLEKPQPVSNMTYNYVAAGYQNKKPIVLKIGLNHKELTREASALQAFSGLGAVKVLERVV